VDYIESLKTWTDEQLRDRYQVEAMVDFWKAQCILLELERLTGAYEKLGTKNKRKRRASKRNAKLS
jgi:hypothetical protein